MSAAVPLPTPADGSLRQGREGRLEREVRRLRRQVRDLATLMDAMREAWCLPPVVEIRAARRAREIADQLTAVQLERQGYGAAGGSARQPQGALGTALDAAREEGRGAAARGSTVDRCPYGRREAALRHAWIQGLHETAQTARTVTQRTAPSTPAAPSQGASAAAG